MNDERSDDPKARALQDLSALADGEVDAARVAAVCESWRADTQLRASWHAYHLIGDTMRSDELATDAAGDAAFVLALRERLAREPVVLAPGRGPSPGQSAPARPRAGWSWKAPAAVAAGFVAVAATLLVTNVPPSSPGAAQGMLAQSLRGTTTPGAALVQVAAPGAESQVLVADGQLVRDARLQRYFAAHNQFAGSSALGAPSGFLRAATTQTPSR
ncbi:MAG: sigma-E factor negative regulatory protein [Piscinibacter sp.]|nr:sigma-E factor negative regulatory protein [Piscinibacter sp.]